MDKKMEESTHPSDIWSGALIAVGLVILQGFFSTNTLDPAATVSVFAFAVAIPILSCNLLTNVLKRRDRKKTEESGWEILFYIVGVVAASVGIGAAFWHTSTMSAFVFILSSLLSIGVFMIMLKRLS